MNAPVIPIAIGDVQGCADALRRLMDTVNAAHGERAASIQWWFCGDLINRGPQSLQALRMIRALGDRAVVVLGNHDLHLLAVAHGIRAARSGDTLDEILAAPDRDELLDWLRTRPLAHYGHGHLMVHAGVLPQWTCAQTLALADELHQQLAGPNYLDCLNRLFGNTPDRWDDYLQGEHRMRVIVNALTRLRFCQADGTMDFKLKADLGKAPAHLMAWFDVPGRRSADTTIVFGHWSALGLVRRDNVIGLDTGCVWNGALTAIALDGAAASAPIWQVGCGR